MYMEAIEAPRLSPEEWAAVKVAILDAARRSSAATNSPGMSGFVRRLYGTLTGNQPSTPLADPRLECLRRFVDTSRRSRKLAEQLVPGLIEQGYNRSQVEAIALLAV